MAEARSATHRQAQTEIHRLLDRVDEILLSGAARPGDLDAVVAELWPLRRRVAGVLAQRLADGRARVPAFAFHLLPGFAGGQLPTYLRRIYEDPGAPDLTRWAARRRATWPQRGEAKARLAFLFALRDPDATLLRALEVADATSPPDGEVLQELLAYLAVLPAERRQQFVRAAAARDDPHVVWLLRGVAHLPDPAVQRLAIADLMRRRDVGAIGALNRLAATAADSGIRAEAAATARRLGLAEVGAAGPTLAEPAAPWPAAGRAFATEIDGDGGQVLALVREWGHGTRLLVHLFHKDGWGLKDAFGFGHEVEERLEGTLMAGFGQQGIALVEIDLPLARGLLAYAVTRNAATGHPIPSAFEVWAPFLHDQFPPAPDEPVIEAELDDARYAGRADLVRQSRRLLEQRLFGSWFFNPDEIEPLLPSVPDWALQKPSAEEYRWLISELVDDATRERLRSRLRRQARMLDVQGDQRARDVALATAASLAEATTGALGRHPFLKGMIDRSLTNLVRAYAASLIDW